MPTNDGVLPPGRQAQVCAWPGGCEEPRKQFPGGQRSSYCARHHSARSQANKRRPAVDPLTGEPTTVGRLALLNWRRRHPSAQAAR